MADLNLSHGTVTDGGGTRTFNSPSNANDGDGSPSSKAERLGFAAGSGTYTSILRTDLGAAYAADAMVVVGYENGSDPEWAVEYSSDGSSWSEVTSLAHVWDGAYQDPAATAPQGKSSITFDEVSARYWRIKHSTTISGAAYRAPLIVWTWEITEATSIAVAPTAEFSATPRSGAPGLVVQFTDLSSGDPTSWSWDFGDGSSASTDQNPSHEYEAAGEYTVTLTATNDEGSDDEEKADYIVVFEPEPQVGIEWDDVTFEDVSGDIRELTIMQAADPRVGGQAAYRGSARIVLDNRDNRYNPENTEGDLYGLLRDGPRVWIGFNSDGTVAASESDVYGAFAGRIADITLLPMKGRSYPPTVEILCEDPLTWISRTPVRIPDSRTRSHRELREAILTAANETSLDLAPEPETMPLSSADGLAGALLEQLNRSNGTRHYCRPAQTAQQWYDYVTVRRTDKLTGVADATFVDGPDAMTATSGWRKSAASVINQQRVTIQPVSFSPSTTVVWVAPTLPFIVTDPVDIFVEFDNFVDNPTPAMNYTGDAAVAVVTPFGSSAQLRIISSGTTEITALQIEGGLARVGLPDSALVDDATGSQDAPRGIRSGSEISGDMIGTIASARGLAGHIVWRYADPKYMPTLTVTNWLPEQFTLQLYDTIELTSDPVGVSGRIFEITSKTHEAVFAKGAGAVLHRTTYGLIESRVQSAKGWFVLDSSELDGTDVLAY